MKYYRRRCKRRSYELRRLRRLSKCRKRKRIARKETTQKAAQKDYQIKAPNDFRLLKNTKECVLFFWKLRNMHSAIELPSGQKQQRIDLLNVEHIDFASTMVLGSIIDEMREKTPTCWCPGRLPKNKSCREYIRESGFLDYKYDSSGNPFELSTGSERMKIERGKTRLEAAKIRSIVSIEKHVGRHLTGTETINYRHNDVIKEICGNAFGWSNAFNRQWTLGVKFEDDKVIFVVLDLGVGILDSLARSHWDILADMFKNKSDQEILEGAFLRKYKSASEDKNRNRGLPSIKKAFDDGSIKELNVLTNNVYLNFGHPNLSSKFMRNRKNAFYGTLYSWTVDSDCFI